MTRPQIEDDDEDTPLAPTPAGDAKLQRWIDLLAALLVRRHPAPFEELAKDVPEYALKLREARAERDPATLARRLQSLKRTFERDKDELRAFGVAIESIADEDGNVGGAYRLQTRDFYLPYLSLAVPGGRARMPTKVDRYGYRALSSLTFDAEELQAVVEAAGCVRALGDPLLAADAASALRKLAVDLPIDVGAAGSSEPRVLLPRARPEAAVFDVVSDALVRRKIVRFTYHAMSTDRSEPREVEPYGLLFLHGHWYLTARDRIREGLRNFRLNRIAQPKVNSQRAQSPDFEVPSDFRLREHAQSRQAWELGDGDAIIATVEFRGESGPAAAAAKLGDRVEGSPGRRTFRVRRADSFVRWLLSFAGEAVPVDPPELVECFHEEVERLIALYGREGDAGDVNESSAAVEPRRTPWQPRGAAAQLARILHVVPQIADGEEHGLRDVAEQIGSDVDTLRRDLYSLVARFDLPAGFVEGVQILLESDRVSARSNHLLRPMRLTISELCALELGLAALRTMRTEDEHAPLERARERLRAVIAKLPEDPIPDGLYGASLGEHGSTRAFAEVRAALRESRELRLIYRRSGHAEARERTVRPHGLVASNGTLYLIGHDVTADQMRVFRMDRVEDAEAMSERFEPAADVSVDDVMRDGKVLHAPEAPTMRVRYSPRVARWIAEREGRSVGTDGTLVLDHPLADVEWAMRHVLQYAGDAEVLAPRALRDALKERLDVIAGALRQGFTTSEPARVEGR